MWHLDAAATLVSFSGISFEGSFFFFFFLGGGGLKLFIGFFTQLFIKGTSGALGKFHVMARYIQTSITKNMRCLEKAKAKYSNVRSIPTQASFPTAYMIQRGSVVTQVQCCSLRSDGPVLWSNCVLKNPSGVVCRHVKATLTSGHSAGLVSVKQN